MTNLGNTSVHGGTGRIVHGEIGASAGRLIATGTVETPDKMTRDVTRES